MFRLKGNSDDLKCDQINQIINHDLQTPPEVDPDIVHDFWIETKEHLARIEKDVLALETDLCNMEINLRNMEIIHDLLREFHTIKGLAGFVNHQMIQRIAHQIETRLDDCRSERREVNREVINLILTSSDYINRFCEEPSLSRNPEYIFTIETYLNKVDVLSEGLKPDALPETNVLGEAGPFPGPGTPDAEFLPLSNSAAENIASSACLDSLTAEEPIKDDASAKPDSVAETADFAVVMLLEQLPALNKKSSFISENEVEYLKAFLDESHSYMDIFEQTLLRFEKEPDNKMLVNELFRGMHTIKGMASAMGFINLTALSHGIENLLQDLRDDQLTATRDLIELLFLGHDYLSASLQYITQTGKEADLEKDGLLEKLRKIQDQLQENRTSGVAPDSEESPETPPLPGLGIDPAFARETIAGILEWVTKIELKLLLLETAPKDPAIILTVLDYFQIINRLAHLVAADQIRDIARQAVALLKQRVLGAGPVTRTVVDWLLQSADYIKKLGEDPGIIEIQEFKASIATHINQFPVNPVEIADIDHEALETSHIQKLGDILIEQKKLTRAEVTELLARQKADLPELRLGQIGIKEGKLKPDELRELLKIQQDSMINHTPVVRETGPETKDDLFGASPKGYGVETPPASPVKKIGEIMVSTNVISKDDLDELLIQQKENHPGLKLGQVAVAAKKAEPTEIIQSIRAQEHEFKSMNVESDNVRVSISKVDNLVDMVGELLIIQSLIEQEAGQRFDSNDYFMTNLGRLARTTKDIQNMSMSLRMISLKATFQKLSRVARDAITQLNKKISFQMTGEETEIDRGVAEKILDPLIHLVKNAISHGIEPESVRTSLGKPAQGLVKVAASSKRGYIFIDISDDGKGMDLEAIRRKALDKKLIEPGVNYTADEILDLVFIPGFSTAETIDNISGRGVGLDVVKTELEKVGGKVEICSHPGRGSVFTLKIPINFAVFNGIIVSVAVMQYIIPTINVRQIVRVTPGQWVVGNGKKMIVIQDEAYPVIPIFKALGINSPESANLVVVLELDQKLKAMPVHGITGKREIVLKPLGNEFSDLEWIAGASILGDGKVSLILDVENIFRMEDEMG